MIANFAFSEEIEVNVENWGFSELSSIGNAEIKIKNNSEKYYKDFRYVCVTFAPSKTKLTTINGVVYEVLKPNESKTFSIDLGFLNTQSKTIGCSVWKKSDLTESEINDFDAEEKQKKEDARLEKVNECINQKTKYKQSFYNRITSSISYKDFSFEEMRIIKTMYENCSEENIDNFISQTQSEVASPICKQKSAELELTPKLQGVGGFLGCAMVFQCESLAHERLTKEVNYLCSLK